MRPHYYYKVSSETEVGKKLQNFIKQCTDATEQARKWVEEQGATTYYESPIGMAGGVAAVEFEQAEGHDEWVGVVAPGMNNAFIPAANSKTEMEMYALPIVSETLLIDILLFKPAMSKSGKQLPFTFGEVTPRVFRCNNSWYADVPYKCEAENLTIINHKTFNAALERASRK